jgi:hypothetical protein
MSLRTKYVGFKFSQIHDPKFYLIFNLKWPSFNGLSTPTTRISSSWETQFLYSSNNYHRILKIVINNMSTQ